MTDRNRNTLLTQDQTAQVSAIGSRFERAWQQGQQPTIEAIAAGVDSHIRPALLQHLAELDIQCRVDRGLPVALEMYPARWPDLDRSELQRTLEAAQKKGPTSVIAADRSEVAITSPQRDTLLCSATEFLQRLRDSRLLPEEELPWPAADTALDEPAGIIDVTQKVVRLPTEEEWEFACRCGRRGTWCFGDDRAQLSDYAWHLGNSENRVHSVRQRKANAWGLYDMHGNESEWIFAPAAAERNFEGQGLVRGGGFYSSPEETASSAQLETELAQPTKGAFRVLVEF